MFEFGLPSIIVYSQKNIIVPRSLRSCRVQDSFILSVSLKSMTPQYATELSPFQPVTLSSFSNTEHRIQQWFIHIKVYFVLSKQEEHITSRSSRHFVSKDQNKLCTYDKKRNRAELWVKIYLFNLSEMYALGSVHEKFDV